MKFNVTKPCETCPFRKDVAPFLRRASEIAATLRDDHNWFACHETTGMKNGRKVKPENQSHCAGAMIVLYRSQLQNIAMRIAFATGLLDWKLIKKGDARVFDSLEEFEAHHAQD